jgi:hypothetical protein
LNPLHQQSQPHDHRDRQQIKLSEPNSFTPKTETVRCSETSEEIKHKNDHNFKATAM